MTRPPFASLALAALLFACRNSAPEPPSAPAPSAPPQGAPAMPPGHPPIPSPMPSGPSPSQPARELRWADPVGWRRVAPSSSMRRAQYAVPGPGGDAELTVFYFGSGQGGSVEDNLRRWHGQFEGNAEAPPDQARTVNGLTVHVTERRGRFAGMAMPGAPAPSARDDWALLGAIAETPDGPWFFKMTGPRATVESARRAFDDLVASFRLP